MTTSVHKDREFDLILFGATGFTGQLVAEYLARHRPEGLRWALAGRSLEKLAQVRAALVAAVGVGPGLPGLPLLIADSNDEQALARLAGCSRVICTTVGPYLRHGKKLLAACAAAGTHYCDLTGEVPFIRWAIDEHDARASASGARIVPTCGFDSLPSDLGVYLLSEHFQSRGSRLRTATLTVDKMRGGFSGGTVASMLDLMEGAQADRQLARLLRDPYALLPDRNQNRGSDRDSAVARWDEELGRWTAPFIMAAINTRVVRRTNALLGFPYGKDFHYSEVMSFPRGLLGMATATGLATGSLAFMALASNQLTRGLLAKRLPAPGEGPSREAQARGCFYGRVVGRGVPDASGVSPTAQVEIVFHGDPGYSETAKMLAEAALCLCQDDLPPASGVLTPAVCMGKELVARLRARDQRWLVSETVAPLA